MFHNGHVFVCTNETEQEFFTNSLFGASKRMQDKILKISKNTGIFLFKYTKNHPIMYGVFLSDGQPGLDLEPDAWGGKLPAQVRVKQWYKFSPLPLSAIKNMFKGKLKATMKGFCITAEQTVELITRFIIGTRLDLNHRVKSNLMGDIGKQIKDCWVKRMIWHLDCSSNWLEGMITGKKLQLQFITKLMTTSGTIHDFISAVQSMGTKKNQLENARFFSEDWDSFFGIVRKLLWVRSQVKDTISAQMNGLLSILREVSAPLVTKSSFPSKEVSSGNEKLGCTAFHGMDSYFCTQVRASAWGAEITQPPCAMQMRYTKLNEDASIPKFAENCCKPMYNTPINYPQFNNQFSPGNIALPRYPTSEKYNHWVQSHNDVDGWAFFQSPSLTSCEMDSLNNQPDMKYTNVQKSPSTWETTSSNHSIHTNTQLGYNMSTCLHSTCFGATYLQGIYKEFDTSCNVWAAQNDKRLKDLWNRP